MAADTGFNEYVLDQLAGLPEVRCRAMFGGFGLYSGETSFAIIAAGRLYLKTDAETRPAFEAHGMGPFRASDRQTLSSYYEVPADVLEDADALVAWSRRAMAVTKGPA